MDTMGEYYDNGDDESEEKPIIRLKIDVSNLDPNKFVCDDDYIRNSSNYNKATTDSDAIIESMTIWGSVAYTGNIDVSLIVDQSYDYGA
jgi:hypothetical protein